MLLYSLSIDLRLVTLVLLGLAAFYVLLLMIQKMLPQKQHQYTGEVDANGLYHGSGTLKAINGDTYTGEFRAGTFHGKGTYLFKKGGSYRGEFRDGLFAGQGKEVYPDGSVYVGGFDHSKRSGLGTMHYSNGAVFTGHWLAGKKEGRGIFKYSDGTRFDGRFVDGKREGTGWIYDKKRRKLQGKWSNGVLMDNGKLTRVLHKDKGKHSDGDDDDTVGVRSPSPDPDLLQLQGMSPGTSLASRQLRQRHNSALAAAGMSPATGTPKRVSASKAQEMSNTLLNLSRKQGASHPFVLEQVNELQQIAASPKLFSRAALPSTTASSTASSSNTASSSSSHSAASTTRQSPLLSGMSQRLPALATGSSSGTGAGEGMLLGDSSGFDSELNASAGLLDDHDDTTSAAGMGMRPSSRTGEWATATPTHLSNAPSPMQHIRTADVKATLVSPTNARAAAARIATPSASLVASS